MKILKKFLILVAILIALVLLLALFVKKEYTVTKEVTIHKPVHEVFDYLRYLKNQDNFSKWAKLDPDMKQTFRGADATVGFVSAWESKKDDVGVGEQEIIRIIERERIDYEIRFLKPFKSVSPAYMATQPLDENHTKVIWSFSGRMSYPFNLMMLFMNFEEMIGADLEEGLENLKALMEE